MDYTSNIYCNLKTCNKCLDTGYAWVTSCSHIFCNEDGEKVFQTSFKCPVCLKALDSKTELVRIQLKSNEHYRKMILRGQRPEVVMDICANALAFWFDQLKQQNDYMKHIIEKEREKRMQLETNESEGQFVIKQMQAKQEEMRRENEYLKKLLYEKHASMQHQQQQQQHQKVVAENVKAQTHVSSSPQKRMMMNVFDTNTNLNTNNSVVQMNGLHRNLF